MQHNAVNDVAAIKDFRRDLFLTEMCGNGARESTHRMNADMNSSCERFGGWQTRCRARQGLICAVLPVPTVYLENTWSSSSRVTYMMPRCPVTLTKGGAFKG